MPMKTAAIVAFLTVGGLSATALGQAPARGPAPPAARGQAATDPKRVLYEMQNSLGMLRGLQEEDSVRRIEYWGTAGSIAVQGRLMPLEKFRVSINYAVPGMRLDFTRGGQREIRMVADKYAWNEETPGGTATPMPAAFAERMLQVWLTPIGLAKAAEESGVARVTIENGATVLSFPVAGATVKATLNALYEPERVEARMGTTLIEITYSEYSDLNDVAKADVFLPRRIVQKQGGATTLDLTVETSNTNNPYVILPVPDNVAKAAPGRH